MENKIIFNNELLKIMALFSQVTKTTPKDCFYDQNDLLVFIVNQGEARQAIGPKGANVKRIESLLNRKIKIVEFNPEIETFIRNLVMPLKLKNVQPEEQEGVLTLIADDTQTRGLLIGRNAKNLRNYENIVKKYFNQIKELKVN